MTGAALNTQYTPSPQASWVLHGVAHLVQA
jgi:hypothetical protein